MKPAPISDAQALPALLRESFSLFLRFAFRELGGEGEYSHNWHIDAIAHQLDRIRLGDAKRLIVTMPPRHLKSLTISIAWVAWMLGRNPALSFIAVSYGHDLAEKHARDCLRIIRSRWYRQAFPRTVLTKSAIMDFETTAGGGRFSTSIDGAITGRGANIIVIDDPLKADEAMHEHARTGAHEWMQNSLMQRLNSQEKSSIILVMQRLHEADLAGELISAGGWDELKLSAIATQDELVPIGNGRVYRRREGCALHPARQSLAALSRVRAANSLVFSAQFQQEPVPREGAFVQRAWFGIYDEPPRTGMVVQSWDTAVGTGVRNDWSVGITARFYQGRYYILDVHRARLDFMGLREAVSRLCRHYGVERLLIEKASSGEQLLNMLLKEPVPGVPQPLPITPYGDKTSRFEAQASRIQAGEVVLPRSAPWLGDFLSEICSFPNGRHDDQADALGQMLANPPPQLPTIVNAGPEIVLVGDEEERRLSSDDDDFDPWGAE